MLAKCVVLEEVGRVRSGGTPCHGLQGHSTENVPEKGGSSFPPTHDRPSSLRAEPAPDLLLTASPSTPTNSMILKLERTSASVGRLVRIQTSVVHHLLVGCKNLHF